MPIAALKSQVAALGWENRISVRYGDGLTVAVPGEVETVVISGMGGMAIIGILEQSPLVVQGLSRLILQPQRSIGEVRRWLGEHGWRLVRESLVWEDGRYYEILCADQGEMRLSEREINFGPILLQEKPLLLGDYLATRKEDACRLLSRLEKEQPPSPLATEKIRQVQQNMLEIDEVIACL